MKRKNGFVASSLMFSFFLVFTLLSLIILASYAHYRNLSDNLNGNILNDLNENVILHKWVTLENVITDGDFNSINNSSNNYAQFKSNWATSYVEPQTKDGINYVSFKKKSSTPNLYLKQSFNNRLTRGNRKIYVAFKHRRTYAQDCLNEDFNAILFIGNHSTTHLRSVETGEYEFENRGLACKKADDNNDYSQWQLYSHIFDVNVNSDIQYLQLNALEIRYNGEESIDIKDVMVVDITSLYNEDTTLELIHGYLDENLPFFEDNYIIAKLR